MVIMKRIYQSYTAENTHLMREYMLHIILRNVRYMRKHKLITEDTFERFKLLDSLDPPEHQSEELTEYLLQLKRTNKTLEPELLRFDSNLESGNLDRAEAQPLR